MTLIELLTVMIVIALLATMVLPVFQSIQERARRVQCTANLRSLYTAANAYVLDNEHWPQISTGNIRTPLYADQWIAALKPYGLSRKNWICPAIQKQLGNPDYENDPRSHRIDYLATPFDDKRLTPYRWSTQPWFAERGDVHGDGNLLIFSDGSVDSLRNVWRRGKTGE